MRDIPCPPKLAAALGMVGLAVAACGGSPTSAPPAAAPTTEQATSAPPTPVAGTPITAKLTEFRIELSQQNFAPGTYTFAAKNDGSLPHALEIEGPGGVEEATGTLYFGQSADLTVSLHQPGSYKVYCPVGNHEQQGMTTTIMVS